MSAEEDIVTVPGGVRVRPAKGTFKTVTTPTGYSDAAFRQAVSAYDTAYHLHGKLPSVDDVFALWPRIPKQTYASLFLTDGFQTALRYRGIEMEADSGLSMEQSMLLMKLTDFTDKRSLGAKLKELGIPMTRYQAWMRQDLFRAALHKRTEDTFKDAMPIALNRLVANADSGDQRAVEKVLEITGRWNPAQQQVEDVKKVVVALVEAVIRHVKDPEEKKAVMNDVQGQIASYTLMEQSQLPRG